MQASGLKSIFHRFRNRLSMRLVLVSDSFIPKGPWELLWLVQAHWPVFGSVKLAPIKYEKSFVPRHMKSDEGLFWKSWLKSATGIPKVTKGKHLNTCWTLSQIMQRKELKLTANHVTACRSKVLFYVLFTFFFFFFFRLTTLFFFVLLICTLLTIKTTIYSGKTMIPVHWSNERQSLCRDLSNPPTHMRNIAYTNQSLSIQGRL